MFRTGQYHHYIRYHSFFKLILCSCFACREFIVPKTRNFMIIHHTRSLHNRVNDCSTNKVHPASFKIFTNNVRLFCVCDEPSSCEGEEVLLTF